MADKQKAEKLRHYEKLMKKARAMQGTKMYGCGRCPFETHDFSYRNCLFSRCPFGKDKEVFRKIRQSKTKGQA